MSELEDIIRRIVREELAGSTGDPWMDAEEAGDFLGCATQRVYALVHAGKLPRHGEKGTRLRFRMKLPGSSTCGRCGVTFKAKTMREASGTFRAHLCAAAA